ncbi:MAG: hypothetical protein IJM59_05590 [Proteobacteria bacterium]|nr:hypothetical protein [Pseudomonadota bacterium]
MQISVKKLAFAASIMTLMVPAMVWAQENPETPAQDTGSSASENEQTPAESSAASDSSEKSQESATPSSESDGAKESAPEQSETAQAADSTEKAPEQSETAQAADSSEKAPEQSETAQAADSSEKAPEQSETAQAASSSEKAPEQSGTAQAAAPEPQSLPDTLASKKSSQEARKEAMRGLANSYPVDGSASAAAPQPAKAADPNASTAIAARTIPSANKTTERMPHFEHHGYFRTRLNAFGNYDLDTRGTSPVAAPLTSKHRGSTQQENISMDDSDALLGGDIRFRYQPTIHITESVRIAGSFDVLDNLVLGTTPNKMRTNWGADEFFTFNGAEPVNANTFGQNAISVKALYGEADTIIGTFKAGRIPAHWGMGLVYNDGGVYKRDQQIIEGKGWKCLDCDSSDAVDRVEYRIRDPFLDILYLDFSWDFVNSGLASYNLQQDSLGQSFDLSDKDDVLQFTLSVFDRPISQQEIDERYRSMFETRQWTADWGALFSYRKQEIAAEKNTQKTGDGYSSTYDLYKKDATAYVLDLWGRFFIPCPKEVMLRLEAEFVGVFGDVSLDTGHEGKSRDILHLGGSFEGEVWWRDLITGLKVGAAWADDMVYSGHSIIEQLDEVPMGSILRFDPNYAIDQIMFRQLMGGINNAWFLNIYGEYKFPISMPQMTMALGARLDLTTSGPIVKSATPGDDAWYGFEGNVKLFYDESDRFRFEIGAGLFVPGDAWEKRAKSSYPILPSQSVYEEATSDNYDPKIAWNVIANLYFMF